MRKFLLIAVAVLLLVPAAAFARPYEGPVEEFDGGMVVVPDGEDDNLGAEHEAGEGTEAEGGELSGLDGADADLEAERDLRDI